MIDIIKEVMERVLEDEPFLQLLGGNRKAVCRIRSPNTELYPRVEFSLLGDQDSDFYDNKPRCYSADIRISIYKKDSLLFELGNRINEVLLAEGFERIAHIDQYDFSVDAFVKTMAFRCKIQLEESEESGFIWLK